MTKKLNSESGQKYSAKQVLDRIDLCVTRSNGVFIKTAVFSGMHENKALDDFMRYHQDAFRVLFREGTSILQATQIYIGLRGLKVILPTNLSPTSVIASAIWSSFILENSLDIDQKKSGFDHLGTLVVLDDLVSDYDDYPGAVITYKARSRQIKSRSIVPQILMTKRAERVIDLALRRSNGDRLDVSKGKSQAENLDLIEGGIWPEDDRQCHEDERIYPGIDDPMKGIRKWNLDKLFLEKGRDLPNGYKLGVYSI